MWSSNIHLIIISVDEIGHLTVFENDTYKITATAPVG